MTEDDAQKKGQAIFTACEILRETYRDLDRLKDDLKSILKEKGYDTNLDEYSYGPKTLYLKGIHAFIFREVQGEERGTKGKKIQTVLGGSVIFCDGNFGGGEFKRIYLRDEPELWVGIAKVEGYKKDVVAWDFQWFLISDELKLFKPPLKLGGSIHNYLYDGGDEWGLWKAKFVGYPLTVIKSREKLKELIVDPLLQEASQWE